MLEGALIFLAGILIGAALRSLPARRKGPQEPKPVCGCGHHYSFHDPGKGMMCGHMHYDHGVGSNMMCTCKRYSGPEPLPSLYAPEIAGETGE
jgi:hypothetical protein